MSAYAERWQFTERLALPARAVAQLVAERALLHEELVGYRLGAGNSDPLFVPQLAALFVHACERSRSLERWRAQSLRSDPPEGGVRVQQGDCVDHSSGPRMLAPAAVGLDPVAAAGAGVIVGVLDSGLCHHHPDFAGDRVAARAAFIGTGSTHDGTRDSHGTAAAGIIAGPRRPSDGGCRYGIASDSRLVIAKVMADSGRSDSFAVEIAAAWAIAAGARILSISVGFARPRDAAPSVLSRSLGRLSRQRRVLIVAAAGNGDPAIDGIKQPAAGRGVLAIGATDLAGRLRPDSLRGDRRAQVFCVAPGGNVVSAAVEADATRPSGRRGFFNGTSAAAPVVAGVAALLLQHQPGCCEDLLRAELARRCQPLPDGTPRDYGAGAVHL